MIAKQIKQDKKVVYLGLEELVKEGKIKKQNLLYLDNRKKKIPYYFSPKDPRMYRKLADNKCRQIFGNAYFKGIKDGASLADQYEHKINCLVKERDRLRQKLYKEYKKIGKNYDRIWVADPYKIKNPALARKIILLQFQKVNSDKLNQKLTKFQSLQFNIIVEKYFHRNNPKKRKRLESNLRKWLVSIDDLHDAYLETNSKKMFVGLSKIFVVDKLLEISIRNFAKIFDLSSKTVSKIRKKLYLNDGSINFAAVDEIFRKYTDRGRHQNFKYGFGFYLEQKRRITES